MACPVNRQKLKSLDLLGLFRTKPHENLHTPTFPSSKFRYL